MASLKELRNRIASVQATQKITRAMQMVAASKLRRAQEAAEAARDADVGHLLYYHVVPPLDQPGAEAAWLKGVDEHFSQFTLGQDGTAVSLPANSTAILVSNSGL